VKEGPVYDEVKRDRFVFASKCIEFEGTELSSQYEINQGKNVENLAALDLHVL
jgi:hypothetical protein